MGVDLHSGVSLGSMLLYERWTLHNSILFSSGGGPPMCKLFCRLCIHCNMWTLHMYKKFHLVPRDAIFQLRPFVTSELWSFTNNVHLYSKRRKSSMGRSPCKALFPIDWWTLQFKEVQLVSSGTGLRVEWWITYQVFFMKYVFTMNTWTLHKRIHVNFKWHDLP